MSAARCILWITAAIFIATGPAAATHADEPSAPPTVTTAGDEDGGVFETGGEESGQDGEQAATTATPSEPADAGTWTSEGRACDLGGVGTCTDVADRCRDGSVPDRWVKTLDGVIKESRNVCPGEELPGTDTPAIDPRSEIKKVLLPEAVVVVQPPDGETLVNLPTIFSTDAQTYTPPALDVLGQTVVFTLTPSTFTWHHGDGTTQTTGSAGKKFVDGDEPAALINHAYTRTADDLAVSVDITWSATWTLNGTAQGAVDGTVTKVGGAQQLDVLEATPTLVN